MANLDPKGEGEQSRARKVAVVPQADGARRCGDGPSRGGLEWSTSLYLTADHRSGVPRGAAPDTSVGSRCRLAMVVR